MSTVETSSTPSTNHPTASDYLCDASLIAEFRRYLATTTSPLPPSTCPVEGSWRDVMKQKQSQNTPEAAQYGVEPYPPFASPSLDPSNWSDLLLTQFLRARKLDLEKSALMFRTAMKFRSDYRVEELGTIQPMPFHREISAIIPHAFHKQDSFGRPIYIQKTGLINVDAFIERISNEKLALTHVHFMEEMKEKMQENSIKFSHPVQNCINLLDLKGVSLNHRKTIKFFSITAWIDQNIYPECLYRMYFVNSPSYFPVFWSLIKPFLDSVTQKKIRIFGSGKAEMARLAEELGEENLPEEYGGKCKCPGGCVKSLSPWPYEEGEGENSGDNLSPELRAIVEEEGAKIPWLDVAIAAGKDFHVEIPITWEKTETDSSSSSLLEQGVWWTFTLAKKDIQFLVYFQPNDSNDSNGSDAPASSSSSSSSSSSRFFVSPERKCLSHRHTFPIYYRGYFLIPHGISGRIHFYWNNSSSYFSGKSIQYKIGIHRNHQILENFKEIPTTTTTTTREEGESKEQQTEANHS